MKKQLNNMKYSSIAIVLALLILFPLAGKSQDIVKTKSVQRSYAAKPDANIQITNKYGDITVIPWEKDSISFKIDVMVSYKKELDAEKMLNSIDFVFNINPGYIVAYTQFKNTKSDIFSDISDIASTIFSSGNIVEINYIVSLPASTSLRIENKYGNVFMSNHSGNFTGILANGDFKANNLTGDTKLDLNFVNTIISYVPKAKIVSSYSEIEIGKLGNAYIESKSSKISLSTSEKLDINSKRDKIYIDTLSSLNLVSDFSFVNIYNLKTDLSAQTTFGDININNIQKTFTSFNITSSYTDVVLGIDKTAAFYADLSFKKTTTTLPQSISSLQYLVVNQNETKLYGSVNVPEIKSPNITIIANSGSLTIGLK